MSRDRFLMMSRVKNEERFIRRCLESAFEVCKQIVIWDDGSTDNTEAICLSVAVNDLKVETDAGQLDLSSYPPKPSIVARQAKQTTWGWIAASEDGERILHFIRSPFTEVAPNRAKQRINEIRDKNTLWYYVRGLDFDHVLCLDGDEWLSKQFIRAFPDCELLIEQNEMVDIPVVYFWDSENQIRRDGVYGINPVDRQSTLRFPRMFSVKNVTEGTIFTMHFANEGNPGGFHCGSVPQNGFFLVYGHGLRRALFPAPIVHGGYIDDAIRQRKLTFYQTIDPNNQTEGNYLHIVGQRNCHQPGDVAVEYWEDN